MTPAPKVYNAAVHGWDIHVDVRVGEGQVGSMMINGEAIAGNAGRYHKNLGKAAALLNEDIVINADVAHVTVESPRASIVAEVCLMGPAGTDMEDPSFKLGAQVYVDQGVFQPDKVARLGMRIRVR
ncbi:MAG: hypothetical protein OXT09_19565 [Myxococcales bacterium]|nr:hypothetical protein [Myxococcales bacterium]